MFNKQNYQQDDHEAGANKMLFGIICVTVLFFLMTMSGKSPVANFLFLRPDFLKDFQLWRLISSLLVNPSGWNLFFEMFALYIFGTIITPRLGGSKMLGLYIFSGLIGNLLWLALNWGTPNGIYGCGGAVTGVIMASAMAAPNMQLYLLFIPFPIKLRTMAVVFMLLDLLLAGLTPFALLDVGGFLGGYLFMRLFLRRAVEWDMLDMGAYKKTKSKSEPYSFVKDPGAPKKETKLPSRNEVDRILDKLSRTGINSLTPEEIKVLEDVREQMNKK